MLYFASFLCSTGTRRHAYHELYTTSLWFWVALARKMNHFHHIVALYWARVRSPLTRTMPIAGE